MRNAACIMPASSMPMWKAGPRSSGTMGGDRLHPRAPTSSILPEPEGLVGFRSASKPIDDPLPFPFVREG